MRIFNDPPLWMLAMLSTLFWMFAHPSSEAMVLWVFYMTVTTASVAYDLLGETKKPGVMAEHCCENDCKSYKDVDDLANWDKVVDLVPPGVECFRKINERTKNEKE